MARPYLTDVLRSSTQARSTLKGAPDRKGTILVFVP